MPSTSPSPPPTRPPPPTILVRNLVKRLPSGGRELTLLDAIDLEIAHGESVAVLGPSGSGKSTLLALLAGLDRPTSGEIFLDGTPIHSLSEDELALLRRRKVGFVFQSFQLLTHQTALENVLLPLELAGHPRPEERAAELLALVGLEERGHHYPVQLSGGEQQRVALARAFATEPPILFADEPTGNLDTATGQNVLQLLDAMRRGGSTTMVIVTHDPSVAERSDRRIHLRDGRIERQERTASDAGRDARRGPLVGAGR